MTEGELGVSEGPGCSLGLHGHPIALRRQFLRGEHPGAGR